MKSLLKRVLGVVRGLFGGESEDHRHEREMAELEAFQRGRLTPGYVARYAAVGLLTLLCALIIVDETWPALFPGSPIDALEHVAGTALNALRAVFGM